MSNKSLLTLKVLTPEGVIIEKSSLLSLTIFLADDRPIGIRPGHAPLIAATKEGVLTIRGSKGDEKIPLLAGVMEIRKNSVTIITAGIVDYEQSEMVNKSDIEYHRLMQTLVNQIMPD